MKPWIPNHVTALDITPHESKTEINVDLLSNTLLESSTTWHLVLDTVQKVDEIINNLMKETS